MEPQRVLHSHFHMRRAHVRLRPAHGVAHAQLEPHVQDISGEKAAEGCSFNLLSYVLENFEFLPPCKKQAIKPLPGSK